MSYFQSARYIVPLIIVKITGLISIVGSSSIIYDILKRKAPNGRNINRKKKLSFMSNRIVLLMSFCDVIYSTSAWLLGTWMVPKATEAFWASGNKATCTAQGFLQLTFYGAATCLNATLAVTYVLVVKFEWKESRLRRFLPQFILLGVPVLSFLGLALWILFIDSYKFNGGPTCGVDRAVRANTVIGMVWQLSCFSIIFISVVILWWTMRKREMTNDRYNFDGVQSNRTNSKRIAVQGLFFAGSFFLTYLPFIVIYIMVLSKKRFPYWLIVLNYVFLPLQGFWNALVYFRRQNPSRKYSNTFSSRFSTFLPSFRLSREATKNTADTTIDATNNNRDASRLSSNHITFNIFPSNNSNFHDRVEIEGIDCFQEEENSETFMEEKNDVECPTEFQSKNAGEQETLASENECFHEEVEGKFSKSNEDREV